jgi:hypothetical protein
MARTKKTTDLSKMDLTKFNIVLTPAQIRIILVTIIILVIVLIFRKQFHNTVERIIVFTIIFLLFLIISKNIMVTLIGSLIIFLLVNLIINTRDTIEKFDNLSASVDKKGGLENTDDEKISNTPDEIKTIKKEIKNEVNNQSINDLVDGDKIKDFINNIGNMPDIKSLINNEPSIDMNKFNSPEVQKSSKGIEDLLKQINGGIELKDDDLEETNNKLNINISSYSDDKKPNHLKAAQKEAYELIDTVKALQDTLGTLSPVLSEGKKLMSIFESLKF